MATELPPLSQALRALDIERKLGQRKYCPELRDMAELTEILQPYIEQAPAAQIRGIF